jgi:hypothetical protein
MSVIANSGGPAAVNFKAVGDSVAGRIISHEDYQCKEFDTGALRFFEKSGNPIMGTKIVLETIPGDEESQVTLFVEKVRMIKAIAAAVRGSGAVDLEVGADLAVTWTGMDGRAKGWQAAYARAEAASSAA